jgi:hypothetical protein
MSKKLPSAESASPLNQPSGAVAKNSTLICALQSTGRIGKSTSLQVITSWLDFAGIKWGGIDADPEHTNFSDYFLRVDRHPINAPGSLDVIFRNAGKTAPVMLVDFPAGATRTVLDHIEARQTLDALDARGVGLTVLLFGSPDPTAESSLREVVTALRQRVKYVIVRNDARFSSAKFDASPAAERLRARGTPTIALPMLSPLTLKEVAALEIQYQRRLTWGEAREYVGTDSHFDLDNVFRQVAAQCEDAASVLLPDAGLVQRRIERKPASERQALDKFSDPLDFEF